MTSSSSNALLGLLHPAWQVLIGVCLVVVTVLGLRQIIQRGPARMTNAMVIIALLIIGVAAIGLLAASCADARSNEGSPTPIRIP